MFFLLPLFLSLLAPNAAVSSPIACEKWFPAKGAPKAVVVVTHGMNMQPSCMDALAGELAAQGFEVYRPAFSGHCAGHGDYLRVTAADWEADARRVHRAAALKAEALGKPLYLMAYSFTSLVFQTMAKDLLFAKRAYLAPPFSTKFWYPAVRWIAGVFPDFSYGTLNPHCAANARSSGRSLLALDEFMEKWRNGEGKSDPAPLLAFAEPHDELVNFEGVKAQAAANGGWRLESISNKGHTLPRTYHHLIVDEPSLGAEEWNRLRAELGKFFTP